MQLADAYCWLEDGNSAKTQRWLAQQSARTGHFLAGLPARAQLAQRLEELAGAFAASDAAWEDHSGSTGTPGIWSAGAPDDWALSPAGNLLAYTSAGSCAHELIWRVRDLGAGCDLPDALAVDPCATPVWDRQGAGLFYTRAEPGGGWALAYHRLGDAQTEDRLIFYRPDRPDWRPLPALSNDGAYLIITVVRGGDIRNLLLVQDLTAPPVPLCTLAGTFDAIYEFVGNTGSLFWMRVEDSTTPRGRVVAVDLRQPDRSTWREVIPQTEAVLQCVRMIHGRLVALSIRDTCSEITIYTPDGALVRTVDLPGRGAVASIASECDDAEMSYSFSDPVTPPVRVRHNLRTGASAQAAELPDHGALHKAENYEYYLVFCPSRDGTAIPIWISHKRGLVRDGANPTYLTAYGGFNTVLAPAFAVERLPWLELGGIYAVAHVRGGGEYGRAWHQAAVGRRKQTSFDDTIAAATWLIDQGYTHPGRLAIGGESNGGLTAAACLMQRPELFGAAVLHSAPLDMLRFDRLGVGRDWLCEYGSPERPADRAALAAYSPLHNIRPGVSYPAMLILTPQSDPIVGEAHSRKFAAALQAAQAGPAPVLLWESRPEGHGMSGAEAAVVWAFLAHTFGMATEQGAGALRCSAADLRMIVAQAGTLRERLGPGWQAAHGAADDPLSAARLAEWRRVAARDEPVRFARRLALEGLSVEAARAALGSGQLDEALPLPGWARTLQACLGRRGPWSRACLDSHEPLPFEDLLLPFVDHAAQRVRVQAGSAHSFLAGGAHAALERQLLRRLTDLASRTLYLEFSIGRASAGQAFERLLGQEGAATTQGYHAFVERLLSGGILQLFREYSVLARLMAETVDHWVVATVELLQRLEADWDALGPLLGQDGAAPLGPVVAVNAGLSDPHQQGRSVSALTFAGGRRLIYKPRSIELEQIYANLLAWCNARGLPLQLQAPGVLCREGYGWVEAVAHAPCGDEAALRHYYQRAGMQLCLMYALEGTDCHSDNLIAAGEQPVLVDLEMLLTPRLPAPANDLSAQPVDQLLGTVMHTLLLPTWPAEPGAAPTFNGFGGAALGMANGTQTRWQAVNTDSMRLQEEDTVAVAGANLPRLGETIAQPQHYQTDLLDGFQQMYRFLIAQRERLLAADGPLRPFAHQRVRVAFRHTASYTRLLAYAEQPRYLRHGVERSIQLEALYSGWLTTDNPEAVWSLAQQEQRELERRDVPHFTHCANCDLLMPSQGASTAHRVLVGGYQLLETRLRLFDETDLSRQSALIRAALSFSAPAAVSGPAIDAPAIPGAPLSQAILIDRARTIANDLAQRALPHRDGGIDWIDLAYDELKNAYLPQSLSDDLYSGRSGIALFFAQLARQTGEEGWRNLALAALPGRTSQDASVNWHSLALITIGAGSGLGGVLYALVRCSQLLDAPELVWRAAKLTQALTPVEIARDRYFDVLGGAAGAILGLLAVHTAAPGAGALERALLCGEHLLAAQIAGPEGGRAWPTMDGKLLTGFSHGAAGIAFALLRLYAVSRDPRFRNAAEAAMTYERSVFCATEANWPDFRSRQPIFMSSWCQGAAGIGLARVGSLAIYDTPEVRTEIAAALRHTCPANEPGDDHLCCGAFGHVEALLGAGSALGRADLLGAASDHAAALVARADLHGWRLGGDAPVATAGAGLFTGLAGIGYTLLRLAKPAAVPSVLLWE